MNDSIRDMDDSTRNLNIAELFCKDDYHIPIYQRNYAWGEAEIEQLLCDLLDMARDRPASPYYIGSLVVWRRPEEPGHFETIDGQQRHTTLALILAVLRHEFSIATNSVSRCNLHFDARPASQTSLQQLFNIGARQPASEPALRAGYEIARRFLAGEDESRQQALSDYLLDKVVILRTIVPPDTDLNHYFEIMNNRGEQLEQHEILKARLMGKLDVQQQAAFGAIWDACADMGRHVQAGIAKPQRDRIFGPDWEDFPISTAQIFSAWDGSADMPDKSEKKTLAMLIAGRKRYVAPKPDEDKLPQERFASIVNFPNFLLQVLHVMKGGGVPLDDKALLDVFEDEQPSPVEFMLCLLKCRMLLDRYVIKREHGEHWRLLRLKRQGDGFNHVNSFGREEDDGRGINKSLEMLLAMFHVSFPAQPRKHWLAATLAYLDKQPRPDGAEYLNFLEGLSQRYFMARVGEQLLEDENLGDAHAAPGSALAEIRLHQGTQVQNFIFNRLDYLLWKSLEAGEEFPGVDMQFLKPLRGLFRFTFRSSVEHFYPQHPEAGKALDEAKLTGGVNNFANLCLISHGQNSRYSNFLPQAKKQQFLAAVDKHKTLESLKQAFMMSYANWGPGHEDAMNEHGRMMIEILRRPAAATPAHG